MATVKFTLWDFLGAIPDPRASSGRRFSLQCVLGIIMAGTLAGRNSIRSIARWAKKLSADDLKLLGIDKKHAPTQTTMHEVMVRLDAKALECAFASWLKTFIDDYDGLLQITLEGKSLKGSKTASYPALHLLAAYCCEISSVIMQKAVEPEKNELTAAKELLFDMPLKGKFISCDAIFCQKELCNIILKNDGDYIFIVKKNQRELLSDIKDVFKRHSFPLYTQSRFDNRLRKY